jgi:hypothetical protein
MGESVWNGRQRGTRGGRPRALLVHSSGNRAVERLARQIAARTGFDVDVIDDRPREPGVRGYLNRLNARLRSGSRWVPAVSGRMNPAHYDLVIVGSHVCGRGPTAHVQAYLTQHAHEIREVALFCTTRTRGAWEAVRRMAVLSGREPVAVLFATEDEVAAERHGFDLDRFVDCVQDQLAATSAYGTLTAVPRRSPTPVLAAAPADAA